MELRHSFIRKWHLKKLKTKLKQKYEKNKILKLILKLINIIKFLKTIWQNYNLILFRKKSKIRKILERRKTDFKVGKRIYINWWKYKI
ncbi:unnamed protein product [Meloidogyne enterolobii]|uniref:Uncharacterized protein n=1 Tax=Meloidogyne enterolobii TaxID=390850 RepID=A0ACB1AMT4_MELEN